MAGRVLLVCALCALCCGGGVGAWGGGYCTESDWRDLRAVARDMSEAEIEGQYCGRKPEFVQRLRASLQGETEERQDGKANTVTDTDEKAQQETQNEQRSTGAPGVSQTDGAHSKRGGDSGRGQSLELKQVSPPGKDGAGSTSQSGGSTSPTEDGATRTDKTVSLPVPASQPATQSAEGQKRDVGEPTTSVSSPPTKENMNVGGSGERKEKPKGIAAEQQQKAAASPPSPPATPNAPTPPTGQSGEAEEKTTSADGQSKANEGKGGEARVEDVTQNTQTTVVGGHAGATQQNSPAVGGGAASGEAERRAVDDAAKGGVEGTTAAPATISVGTNAAKPVPGDSDGGSAASHCTSPVALLLLLACAVAAAMAAA
ncbi:hypothetical protein TraAM80_09692 [Trypanosoma rangeli]|uniref:Mucin-associated surface protein (MASP) n=1 Tax=Trypanosoma rangeli TaxID=5698 RepID=A0A3R7R655_TRYRA|nr:uncharacterized protein TraAM80_09692 [Trypanosoma rangeli]RNE96659.1 hypothetical protein TraAM80_09692 [Trypanosoma rangeli]|eukprot:RNE96659.1 hypothetical protein TraAM80_09692 [Trypanosoma rangeli]